MSEPVSVGEMQRLVAERFGGADAERGTARSFLWFMEEVGELATALQGDDHANKAEEMADVLAWLCTLANLEGIDLEAALRAKYHDRPTPPELKR